MLKGSMGILNYVDLNFKNQDKENLPQVKVFFTSINNSYGALWEQWLEGKVYHVTLDPKENLYKSISLNRQVREKLPERSFCNQDTSYYKCQAQR